MPFARGDHVRLTRPTPVAGESLIRFQAGDEGVVETAGQAGCLIRIHGVAVIVPHTALEPVSRVGAADPAAPPDADLALADGDLDLSFLD